MISDIIEEFLEQNPQFLKAEWDGDITVYFKDNPNEPFCITEFEWLSPTRCLLEDLEEKLRRNTVPTQVEITFKTPDVLYYALKDIEDEDERDAINEELHRWIKYGEYVTLEYDVQTKTMKVLEA